MKRIAVGGFHHETNCFIDTQTDYDFFASHRYFPPLVRGKDVLEWLAPANFGLSGFLKAADPAFDILPLVWCNGGAGGMVTRAAFERITAELVAALSLSLPVHGVYLDLHGAMVTEDFEDAEGELLRRVRAVVGDEIPIVVSLDYHANVTHAMIQHADALEGYRTYPHVDSKETGMRAAKIMRRLLHAGRPAGRALRKLPFLIPMNDQCTLVSPSKDVVRYVSQADGRSLNLNYLAGFPASDLFECGPAIVAYADTQADAQAGADQALEFILTKEAEFATPVIPEDQAVREAIAIAARSSRPVIIADTQDNPGCGGTSDTTGIIKSLLSHGASDAVVGFLCDAEAAQAAHAAGEHATLDIALGGRHGPAGVTPLEGRFEVLALGSGQFTANGAVLGHRVVDLGHMACLRIGGVRIVVTSKRIQAHDISPFLHLGVDPSRTAILVLKSTCHFQAEFRAMAQQIIIAASPGGFESNPENHQYRRLRENVRLRPGEGQKTKQ